MRLARRLTVLGLSSLAVFGASIACTTFTGEEEGAGPDAAPAIPEVGPRDDGATKPPCSRAALVQESFDAGLGVLTERRETADGAVYPSEGALVATFPFGESGQADVREGFNLSDPLASARLEFTFVDMVAGPPSTFMEVGCGLELRVDAKTFTTMRLELRSGDLKLDDVSREDGGTTDSGVGPTLATLTGVPRNLAVRVDIEIDPADTQFVSRATTADGTVVTKVSPLAGHPTSATLRCGILNANGGLDGGAAYTVKIDDVVLELCKR